LARGVKREKFKIMSSLRDKILLFILLPVVLMVAGFVVFNFFLNSVVNDHFEDHALELITKLSHVSKDAILMGDKNRLAQIIFDEKYLTNGISYLSIYDKNGEVLADTNLGSDVTGTIFFQAVDSEKYEDRQFFIKNSGQDYYFTEVVVRAGVTNIGLIRIVFNFTKMTEEFHRMTHSLLIFGILFFILLFYLSQLLARSLIGPIKDLTSVVQEYAQGNYESFAKVVSLDEIGDLAVTFNVVKSNLDESQKKLIKEKLEVEAKAEELKTWQKTAVARELKMIELKNKINDLENKSNNNLL